MRMGTSEAERWWPEVDAVFARCEVGADWGRDIAFSIWERDTFLSLDQAIEDQTEKTLTPSMLGMGLF